MSQDDNFNIFDILEINPNEPWSQDSLKRQHEKMRGEWQKIQGQNNEKGRTAKINKALRDRINQAIANEATCRTHAKQRQLRIDREINKGKDEAKKEFQEYVDLLKKDGRDPLYIYREELENLRLEFGKKLTEQEIDELINFPIRDKNTETETDTDTDTDFIEPSKANEISDFLMRYGKKENKRMNDLYDLLELDVSAPLAQLMLKSEAIYRTSQQNTDSLLSFLAGQCLHYFEKEKNRRKYERTRKKPIFEEIFKKMGIVCSSERKVRQQQIAHFIKIANENKIDTASTLDAIYAYADKNEWHYDKLSANFFSEKNNHSEATNSAIRPFPFNGQKAYTKQQLAALLSTNYEDAHKEWSSGRPEKWLRAGLKDIELERAIDFIKSINDKSINQIFMVIYVLDPSRPLTCEGFALTKQNIKSLVEDHVAEINKNNTSKQLNWLAMDVFKMTCRLIDSSNLGFDDKGGWFTRFLVEGGKIGDYETSDTDLQALIKNWDSEFIRCYEMLKKCPGGESLMTRDIIVDLLAAATPETAALDDLRHRANTVYLQRNTKLYQELNLPEPSRAGPAELSVILCSPEIIGHYQKEIERDIEIEKSRAETERKNKEELRRQLITNQIRMFLAVSAGFIIGGCLGSLISFGTLWVPIVGTFAGGLYGFEISKTKGNELKIFVFVLTAVLFTIIFLRSDNLDEIFNSVAKSRETVTNKKSTQQIEKERQIKLKAVQQVRQRLLAQFNFSKLPVGTSLHFNKVRPLDFCTRPCPSSSSGVNIKLLSISKTGNNIITLEFEGKVGPKKTTLPGGRENKATADYLLFVYKDSYINIVGKKSLYAESMHLLDANGKKYNALNGIEGLGISGFNRNAYRATLPFNTISRFTISFPMPTTATDSLVFVSPRLSGHQSGWKMNIYNSSNFQETVNLLKNISRKNITVAPRDRVETSKPNLKVSEPQKAKIIDTAPLVIKNIEQKAIKKNEVRCMLPNDDIVLMVREACKQAAGIPIN